MNEMTREEMTREEQPVPKIYKAMAAIMRDTTAIAKDRYNKEQGWRFRGIDDVYNSLHPVLAKHDVFVTTDVLEERREERSTRSGGTIAFTRLFVKFSFVSGEDGSSVCSTLLGEAMDPSDKSTNKALSNAHKYCLLQAFLIPTLDIEADSETPESPVKTISEQEYVALKQEIEECGLNFEGVTTYVQRKLGIQSLDKLPITMLKPLCEQFPGMIKKKEEAEERKRQLTQSKDMEHETG